jgi:hypothetical protein
MLVSGAAAQESGQLFLKCSVLSAAQAELRQNLDCFVNDLIIGRQHDVSQISHTQDTKSRYEPKRPILPCKCFEAEAAQGKT